MAFTTLVSASELAPHVNDRDCAIVDCRFSLDNTGRGQRDYLESHIPGAAYAHLDHDLAGPKVPGKTGRHPLPDIRTFAETASSWGIDGRTQVFVYDDSGGAMAARLWWLLQWAGHPNTALLDGGWQAWCKSGLPIRGGPEYRIARRFEPTEVQSALATIEQVQEAAGDSRFLLLDARSGPRYRGEAEPIDVVAGHIPGAVSSPFEENLTPEGTFLSPQLLRKRFERLLKSIPTCNVICYCGSGVTAAHNLLAISYAGLGMARLYPGSWSEWIVDPARPIASGSG
jgi:thiosulfate/3-mercaptopyruvate sulfurtransferase